MAESSEVLHSSICALAIGDSPIASLFLSAPFGYIALHPDFVLIQIRYYPTILLRYAEFNARLMGNQVVHYPKEIRLTYQEITNVHLKTSIASRITIEHNNPHYPFYIMCFVLDKKLYNLLNELHQKHARIT